MQSEGARLRRMREAELKKNDRARIVELRQKIKTLRAERPERMRVIRELCRSGHAAARARARELREETMARLRREIATLRAAQRSQCSTTRTNERAAVAKEIATKQAELFEARSSFRTNYGKRRSRTTATERREESRHDVISNLPAELVPVFKRVEKGIKGGPRRSRTEAFLEWAEENPDEVHGILYAEADRDVARMIREHEQLERRRRA